MSYAKTYTVAIVGVATVIAGEARAWPAASTRISAALPLAAEPASADKAASTERQGSAVIFVNFDGADLVAGGFDDATRDVTEIAELAGSYPAYQGSTAHRIAIIDAVRRDWADFNVEIVTSRPESGSYLMCMVGAKAHAFGTNVIGIAPLDCNDHNASNIVYSFVGEPIDPELEATVISQEVAHALGLEHVSEEGDIMYPYAGERRSPAFLDACRPIEGTIYCGSQHRAHCADGQQNGYAELRAMLGPALADDEAPELSIVRPKAGSTVTGRFTVEVAAQDNRAIARVELYIDDSRLDPRLSAPYRWSVSSLAQGEHELFAVAVDTSGNATSSEVRAFQSEPGTDDDDDDDDDDDTEGQWPQDSGGGVGQVGDSGDGDGGRPRNASIRESGCMLAHGHGAPGPWAMLLIWLGAKVSQRRRRGPRR